MYKHHQEAIEKITNFFREDKEILSVILAGSIAHGFEKEESDIDVMLIISEEDYKKRFAAGNLNYYNPDLCDYDGGYVDGKYITLDFLRKVLEKGSEPARYAFQGASVLFSQIEGLQDLINMIAKYPIENKDENIKRFYAQFEAWKWYCSEAFKKGNEYLLNTSLSKFLLFGGRLILTYNETLYPYHKWFLKVLETVEKKPDNFIKCFNNLLTLRDKDAVEQFYSSIIEFNDWYTGDISWPSQFILDSEINWMTNNVPVDDI